MIERYTLPAMGKIWEAQNRFQKWLDIEIAACEAMAELGKIPAEAVKVIKEKANFNVERINEIEEVVNHDVIAFLTCVGEFVGEESRFIHLGMTSSDVLDTATAIQMKESGQLLLAQLHTIRGVLVEKAQEYRMTPMIGRTHGIHAEPITFGLKMLLWAAEVDRDIKRMEAAIDTVSVGMISGAVGTYANIDPLVEEIACKKLGLNQSLVSTQVLQRDRHAEFMATLAVIAGSLDKFATELRNLQRTDILEVEEYFGKGQKGSSAMPHKRNPITSERVSGLSRVIRGNAMAAMENQALWHERDITHSSVERVIIPDSCILMNYMMDKFIKIMQNLLVYPENMMKNINRTHGLVFSQRVMLALVEKGISREQAYELVQRNSLNAWNSGQDFQGLLLADAELGERLSAEEIKALFNFDYHLAQVDAIFKRFGL
ncbi:MAG: adenylosuccinate lyase [Carboxydocellales bacterium]